jgi:hypothetical protein
VVEKLQQVPVAAWFLTGVAAFFLMTVKFDFTSIPAAGETSVWANEAIAVADKTKTRNDLFIFFILSN